MSTSSFCPRLLLLTLSASLLAHLSPVLHAQTPDSVSLVLIDGDIREDWPDNGVVGFRRKNTSGPLTVQFQIAGTALRDTDYAMPAGNSITIPDGDHEAWLGFAPLNKAISPGSKTIVVTLVDDSPYNPSSNPKEQSVTLKLETINPNKPCLKAVVRFLNQAAFGADGDLRNAYDVLNRGYANWINFQFTRPVGTLQPYLASLGKKAYADRKVITWWSHVMNQSALADPLRQRVGFALSEFFVISDNVETLANNSVGMANYYDMLLKGAFGNFRDLLYNVGTHPCMGVYLSHLQNQKADPVAGTVADENFAREIMQLFSIGLWQLNQDGTRTLDSNGEPIPTYDIQTITNMARVMTGFSFGGPRAKNFWDAPENYVVPMRMWDAYHDLGAKTIVALPGNPTGVQLPARTASVPDKGTAGLADYTAAIDTLFNHPNTPPFFCKQLIQRLITSNPSPAYVKRVADVFANNGSGIRGDLKAVIKAVLLDSEARDPAKMSDPTFGKLKEPYLRTVNLARAVNAKAANNLFLLSYLDEIHLQQPMSSPSVFNFFKPGYSPAGPVNDQGLVAPEFQILNAITSLSLPNYYLRSLQNGFNRWGSNRPAELVLPHLTTELALYNDVPALLRRLDLIMTGGTLPKEQHQIIREAVESIRTDMWKFKEERVRMAVYLIATSADYAVLR